MDLGQGDPSPESPDDEPGRTAGIQTLSALLQAEVCGCLEEETLELEPLVPDWISKHRVFSGKNIGANK